MAYRLLCHAEIEDYVEEASRTLVLSKIKEAKAGRATLTALTLIAYHKTGWDGLMNNGDDVPLSKVVEPNPFKDPIAKLLENAAQEYLGRIVSNNHGIRTANLHRLLKPTGLDFDSLDPTWVTEIDEFGKARGLTAHTSSVGVTRPIDPKDEHDRVVQLRNGLEKLDVLLNVLLKSKN